MDINGFQTWAEQFDIGPKTDWYYALGLAGETGELIEKIKKGYRTPPLLSSPKELALELSDILWYLSRLAAVYGYSMTQIMALNVEKLEDRAKRGKLQGKGDNR